jgi:hypothetical protein
MRIFKVSFVNQGKVYVVFAENVRQSDLFGFIEIEKILFGENSSVVIDPAEEKLKSEFEGVNRTLVPMHSMIRVDEVEKRGQSKILDLDENANVTPFPSQFYPPSNSSD